MSIDPIERAAKIENALKIAKEIGDSMNERKISTMETGVVFCFLWNVFKRNKPQHAQDIEKFMEELMKDRRPHPSIFDKKDEWPKKSSRKGSKSIRSDKGFLIMSTVIDQLIGRLQNLADSPTKYRLELGRKFELFLSAEFYEKMEYGLEKGLRINQFMGFPINRNKILPPNCAAIVNEQDQAVDWFYVSEEKPHASIFDDKD